MYSREALEAYGELLKVAGSAVADAWEKNAGNMDRLIGGMLGSTARGGALASEVAARAAPKAVSRGTAARALANNIAETSRIAPAAAAAAPVAEKAIPLTSAVGGTFRGTPIATPHRGGAASLLGNIEGGPAAMAQQPGVMDRLKGWWGSRRTPTAPAAAPPPVAAPPVQPTQSGLSAAAEALNAEAPAHRRWGPGALGAGVLGAGATGLGAYHLGKNVQQGRDRTQRNLAFGAGAATGLVAPSILRNVADTAQTVALSPSNLIPRRSY